MAWTYSSTSSCAVILLCLSLSTWAENASDEAQRKISVALNPGCETCNDNTTTLIHVRSVGAKDELHFLWDFTGKPAALVLYYDSNKTPVNVTIDWTAFWDGRPSIALSREPKYYFGIALQTLWAYEDPRDEALFETVTDPAQLFAMPLVHFDWEREALTVSETYAEVSVSAKRMNKVIKREQRGKSSGAEDVDIGQVRVTFSTHGIAGHSGRIPHLLHTENATEIDLILKDIHVEGHNFSDTRLALGVTVISMDDHKGNFSLSVRRSVDDEFTPGIFELINLSSRGGRRGEGFVQYRPVSYTNPDRDVSTSTLVRQSEPRHPEDQLETLSDTLFAAVKGIVVPKVLVQNMNVSFGVSGDGFYEKTNYTTWTFITAYGQPMPERLSTLVVVLAALGLGLPMILLISGGCFVCLRRARSSSTSM